MNNGALIVECRETVVWELPVVAGRYEGWVLVKKRSMRQKLERRPSKTENGWRLGWADGAGDVNPKAQDTDPEMSPSKS